MVKAMTIYDISLPVSEALVVWPGDPPVRITQPAHLDRGDPYTVSRLELGAHTGTHVDAPAHFIGGGAGVDRLPLDLLVGPARVVHVPEARALTPQVLEGLSIPPNTERLLFRTRNSERWGREGGFWEEYVGVPEAGARWLVARGVRLVGIDYLSISPYDDLLPPHHTLLGAGVIVVEGLDLRGIAPGAYQLVCLPLKLVGGDGAPARAILIEEEAGASGLKAR
jgi:arylformamidase